MQPEWGPEYEVWDIHARWLELCEDGKEYYPNWLEGAPDGFFWNRSTYHLMPREGGWTREAVAEWAWSLVWLNKNSLRLTVKFKGMQPWYLTWFCHETWDDGRSDAEFMQSFRQWIYYCEDENMRAVGDPGGSGYPGGDPAPHFLMGAEDRWRWRGSKEHVNEHGENKLPCRCDGCKKTGKVRVNH